METQQQLKTAPEPLRSFANSGRSLVQRKCACGGGAAGVSGKCGECGKKKLSVQRRATTHDNPSAMPPVVHDVLRSPGQSLDAETRAFMEPRFGHDFSKVRVHTGAQAARSAVATNALAYTVGQDVVFAANRYAPHSTEGKRLLAHELAHTIQQGEHANISPGNLDIGQADDVYEREADSMADSVVSSVGHPPAPLSAAHDTRPMLQRQPAATSNNASVQVGDSTPVIWFRFNSTELRHDAEADSTIHFQDALQNIRNHLAAAGTAAHYTLHGYASVEGDEGPNTDLSQRRADRIKTMLVAAGIPAAQITAVGHGEDSSFSSVLAWNRRVEIEMTPQVSHVDMPDEQIEVQRPRFVCGPDVSAQTAATVSGIRSTFGGWTPSQKENACDALDGVTTGYMAWDIVELHNNDWINRNYRPPCATQGATPACGASIQIDDDCHYAGSVNYVIFGAMCKLCYDYYYSIMLVNTGLARFTSASMLQLIDIYKGSGVTGLATPSGNFAASQAWALAGYRGWPSAGSPSGDRSNCRPICPTPYTGPSFSVNWYPNQYFTGDGGR